MLLELLDATARIGQIGLELGICLGPLLKIVGDLVGLTVKRLDLGFVLLGAVNGDIPLALSLRDHLAERLQFALRLGVGVAELLELSLGLGAGGSQLLDLARASLRLSRLRFGRG